MVQKLWFLELCFLKFQPTRPLFLNLILQKKIKIQVWSKSNTVKREASPSLMSCIITHYCLDSCSLQTFCHLDHSVLLVSGFKSNPPVHIWFNCRPWPDVYSIYFVPLRGLYCVCYGKLARPYLCMGLETPVFPLQTANSWHWSPDFHSFKLNIAAVM